MIKVEDPEIFLSSGFDLIFDRASFQINTDWKLGFVEGRNGRGKDNILNLDRKYRSIVEKSPVMCVLITFRIRSLIRERQTRRYFTGNMSGAKSGKYGELSYLDMWRWVLWRTLRSLSKWRARQKFYWGAVLSEGNFLLIDEPTNHLDTAAREKVSEYLNRKKVLYLYRMTGDF